jgi:hypothetical protein
MGKNVMFTPINIVMNWIFNIFGLRFMLNKKGNQWVAPAMTANTAPIERT